MRRVLTSRVDPIRSAESPSGPPGLPFVGHAPAFLRDKLGFLTRCAARYGPAVQLHIGGPTYLITRPDDVKHILVSQAGNYEKTPRLIGRRARRFFGEGLTTARGQAHLRDRRMLQPVFHRATIARFAGLIHESAAEMTADWSDGTVVDVHRALLGAMQRFTLRALFEDALPAEMDRLRRAVSVRRRYQEYLLGSVFPFADRVPTPLGRAYMCAHRDIDAAVEIRLRRRQMDTTPKTDLLALLIHARFEDGSGMTERQIRDEVRTLTVAGYETVAEALTWGSYAIATHPDVEAALVSELSALPDTPLGIEAMSELRYCRMVLAESMRLYPPTWLFVRVAEHDDVLPSGSFIPAGAKIYLSQWVMHRNPEYFPDPERFDPERFTDDAIRSRRRFTYIPFGAGRRLCIGEDFAWMQGVLALAWITRRFRLRLAPGQTITPEPNVTLRPRNGIRMRIAPR